MQGHELKKKCKQRKLKKAKVWERKESKFKKGTEKDVKIKVNKFK